MAASMIDEQQLATTGIKLNCEISPVGHVGDSVGAIVSSYVSNLVGAFYSRNTARKVNSALTELIDNVLSHSVDKSGALAVQVELNGNMLKVRVAGPASLSQYESVRDHVASIRSAPSSRDLFRRTIHERRKKRLRGGLGLLRLVAENKFDIKVAYDESILSVETEISVGGLG